jgi:hypothetical protein
MSFDYIPSSQSDITLGSTGVSSSEIYDINPNIALLQNGNFVISWQAPKSSTTGDINNAIVKPDGSTVISPLGISTFESQFNCCASIASDPSGRYMILWNEGDNKKGSGTYSDVYVQIMNSSQGNGFTPPTMMNKEDYMLVGYNMDPFVTTITDTGFTSYVILWNKADSSGKSYIQGQQITANLFQQLPVKPADLSGADIGKVAMSARAVDLGSKNFVMVYQTMEKDISAQIIKGGSTFTTVKGEWRVNSDQTDIQKWPDVEALHGKIGFVVVWMSSNVKEVKAQMYDINGIEVGVNKTIANCQLPRIKSLGSDGFIIIYLCGATGNGEVRGKMYTNTFDPIGTEKVMSSRKLQNDYPPAIGVVSGSSLLLVYATSLNVYIRPFTYTNAVLCYLSCGTCTVTGDSSNHQCLTCDTANGYSPLVDDASFCYKADNPPSGYYFNIDKWKVCYPLCTSCTTFPTDDTVDMKCKSNSCVDGYYPKVDYMTSCFKDTIPGYHFDDSTHIYKPCYSTCQTCTGIPIKDPTLDPTADMLCQSCKAGYYSKIDGMTNCYKGQVDGYFLDGTTYQKCYSSCKTCSGYPANDPTTDISANMLCQTCNPGYYPKVDLSTSCYSGTIPGYVLDGSIYQKQSSCYTLCETCKGYPTDATKDMLCKTCKTGYYPKYDNMTSCFNGKIPGYTLVGSIYQKEPDCYSPCKTCTGIPSNPSIDMLCEPNSCVSGYFPRVDKMTSCFQGVIPGFYFDGYVYQKCYRLCRTCTGYSSSPSADMKCESCINDYYPKADNLASCFTGDIDFYYLDRANKLYKKCNSSCLTCEEPTIDTTNHNCIKCNDGYFPLEGLPSNCFKPDDEVKGYYFDTTMFRQCYSSCKTCKTKGSLANPNCTSCKEGGKCDPCTDIIYKDQCISACPDGSVYDSPKATCLSCKDNKKLLYNSQCVDLCPSGYYNNTLICQECGNGGLFNLNGQCVDKCPKSFIVKSGTCISSIIS